MQLATAVRNPRMPRPIRRSMIDYAQASLRMFHRNLEAAAATPLDEPHTTEPARARRIIALLVETLGGFAFGTAAGPVLRAVLTRYGAGCAGSLRAALSPGPRAQDTDHLLLLDDEPALSTRMLARVRARVSVAARDLSGLQAATLAAITAIDSGSSSTRGTGAEAMFGELHCASLVSDRLELELRTGWVHACAAIERRQPRESQSSPRARELWASWSRLAGNPPAPGRAAVHREGFITQIG